MQKAIKLGADPNYQTQRKWTPLHHAVLSNTDDPRIVEYLIKSGSNVNAREHSGQTPLSIACTQDNIGIASFLVQCGAQVNARDQRRNTALHWAILGGATDCVKLLLTFGADVNAANMKNRRPIHYAVYKSDYETVALLLSRGATVADLKDNILHSAVANKRLDMVMILLHHGCNIDIQDTRGFTPLHTAVLSRNVQIVQMLLQRGADMNLMNSSGQTAVEFSIQRGSLFVTETLLRHATRLRNLGTGLCSANYVCLMKNWNVRLEKLDEECSREVALMSRQMVSSEHCYCVKDLLVRPEDQLVRFLVNDEVRDTLKRIETFERVFKNYSRLIVGRLAMIIKRAEIIARSNEVLRSIFLVKIPDVCIQMIGSFLSETERLGLIDENEVKTSIELVLANPD